MIDIVVPKWGLTMEDAVVTEWLKQVGDEVAQGEVIVLLESEKIDGEVESPAAGILAEIVAPAGETVLVEGVLGRIDSVAERGGDGPSSG